MRSRKVWAICTELQRRKENLSQPGRTCFCALTVCIDALKSFGLVMS